MSDKTVRDILFHERVIWLDTCHDGGSNPLVTVNFTTHKNLALSTVQDILDASKVCWVDNLAPLGVGMKSRIREEFRINLLYCRFEVVY